MKKALVLAMIMALLCGGANAVTVSLGTGNVGINGMSYSVSGTDILIWEDWSSSDLGTLLFDELAAHQNYQVYKYITNNSGSEWDHFANELLDPGVDAGDINPQPSWIPAGYSTSNDDDGLSFAQGSGITRSSEHFTTLFANEYYGHDYLDFYGGTVSGFGGTDTITFGLRDNGTNQPFLLAQRPNEFTNPAIPEPTTMLLVGLGLAGVAVRKRLNK